MPSRQASRNSSSDVVGQIFGPFRKRAHKVPIHKNTLITKNGVGCIAPHPIGPLSKLPSALAKLYTSVPTTLQMETPIKRNLGNASKDAISVRYAKILFLWSSMQASKDAWEPGAEGQLCPCAGVIDDCVKRGWTQNVALFRIMTDRQSVNNIKLPVPFLKCCHASAVKLAASADCSNWKKC